MYKIKDASENEMILLFLRTEINSNRFKKDLEIIINNLNVDKKIILKPNLKSDEENKLRKNILAKYRGYGENRKIFHNFPLNIKWEWCSFTEKDLKKIKYINYDYWIKLSNDTRLAIDAVDNIKNGVEIYETSNQQFIDLANKIDEEDINFPNLIIMASIENKDNIVVLEGHLRLTALILSKKKIKNKKILVGFVKEKELRKWDIF